MPNRKEHREKFWDHNDKDSYSCPECGSTVDDGAKLDVHHIDGDPSNGDLSNLLGLCRECHMNEHGEWTNIYKQGYSNRYIGIL